MPRLAFLIAAALALLLAPVGRATAAVPPDVLAAAKREGVVVWYTSIGLQFLTAITKRFEATHPGLTLQTFRSPANLLPARILTEQRSGKFSADVVNADNIPLAQLRAAGALDPKFEPRSLYMTTTVLAWNAQKLKADGLRPPATLADLAKPEWRGKIGIDSTAYNWYQAVIETAPGARDLLKAIADNHPFIVAGHDAVVAQLGAGEFDVTPTAYGFLIEQGRLSGLPIAFLNPRPLFVDESPVALAKNAPHPNAAQVLLDWLLSKDGQQAIVDLTDRASARSDVRNNPRVFDPRAPMHVVGTPDAARYNALVTEFKALFGIN
jgi:iron(III) transport system substrate-binding protein